MSDTAFAITLVTGLNWIASNVILLDDSRAPIVRRVEMAD